MILSMLLACPVEAPPKHNPGGGDSGPTQDTADTGNTAAPGWDCALDALSPVTVPARGRFHAHRNPDLHR